ncbi:MAG: transposase [Patescibacteria group bacterium]
MDKKFRDKYRIASARLRTWDYSRDAYYFITICTKNRANFFGEIHKNEISLSPVGKIVEQYWREIPAHFANVKLDKFVIMPNHLHGILVIDNWGNGENRDGRRDEAMPRLYTGLHPQMSKISPKPKSLPTIIGSFKSICTKHIRKINPDFSWQTRYHDHIIRDDRAYNDIQAYILNNPANWHKDKENIVC